MPPPFEAFLDPEDLTACVEAHETAASLNARALRSACYFPLWLHPSQPFGELFLTARATPRSFRYGVMADNVLGLQWKLPNGRSLRLGGRVVKNVAGFDFIRFLSASRGRFGQPQRLVLRLRPQAQENLELMLRGPWPALKATARKVRSSSWAHALDICDLHAVPDSGAIHLGFRAKAELLPAFKAEAKSWAADCGVELEAGGPTRFPVAKPWARAQAPLDDCVDLAREWLGRYGGSVHAMLGQGVLQLQDIAGSEAGAEQGLHELHRRLAPLGGHCEHPSLLAEPEAPQARWETELLKRLEAVA
jgi:hypothetical protein